MNNLKQYCVTKEIGLSNACADAEITLREDFSGGSSTGNAAIPTNAQFDQGFTRVPIKLDRLDNVWQAINDHAHKIDIIKMDIEGHEDYCLQGGFQAIQENRPIILMEINKPYYVARGVELDDLFLPLIPEFYLIFKEDGGKWRNINSLNECKAIDNRHVPAVNLSLT